MFGTFSIVIIIWRLGASDGHPKNLAWNGGPLEAQCERGADSWVRGEQHLSANVIATKALTYKDEIYVITPRMKRGVLASLWLVVREKHSAALRPYPGPRAHALGDCGAVQNAVDVFMDHLGNLWILDSGVIETLSSPQCTCPPKVVEISLVLGKVLKTVEMSSISEPTSALQNIAVEYGLGGKAFIYVSDAVRGSVLVREVSSGASWSVPTCAPSSGLQILLIKRLHSVLIIVRLHYPGLLELDTATLRRKGSSAPLRVFGEHSKPVVLLGTGAHRVFLRHAGCSDVLSWDTRGPYNASLLDNIHSAGPALTPTSVAADPLSTYLLVLDSNYLDTIHDGSPTYHKITFI